MTTEEVWDFPEQPTEAQLRIFHKVLGVDLQGDGDLTSDQLKIAAQLLGYNPTPALNQQMVDTVNEHMGGLISLKKFASKLNEHHGSTKYQQAELKDAFEKLDKDGNGYLNREELKEFLMQKGDDPITSQELDGILDDFDLNGDGKLDYAELAAALCVPPGAE